MAFDPDAYLAATATIDRPTGAAFDPDEYLRKTEPKTVPFDPDAYLAATSPSTSVGTASPVEAANALATTRAVLDAATGPGSIAFGNNLRDRAMREDAAAAPDVARAAINAATGPGSIAWANNLRDTTFDQPDTPGEVANLLPAGGIGSEAVSPSPPVTSILDNQPKITQGDTISSALQKGDVGKAAGMAYEGARRQVSGLIGPTESERIAHSIPFGKDAQGNRIYRYKPLGNRLDQEAGLMTPYFKVEPFEAHPDDSAAMATTKAVGNITQGLVGSIESPLGVMIPGGAELKTASRVASGAFAVDTAAHVPEQLDQMAHGKTLQAKIEGGLGAVASLLLTGAAGTHSLAREKISTEQVLRAASEELRKIPEARAMARDEPYQQVTDRRTIDGLVFTKNLLREKMDELPKEEQNLRNGFLDEIDAQLLNFSRADVSASEARVAAQGTPKPPGGEAAQTVATGGPQEQGGRSALFSQAVKESGDVPAPIAEATDALKAASEAAATHLPLAAQEAAGLAADIEAKARESAANHSQPAAKVETPASSGETVASTAGQEGAPAEAARPSTEGRPSGESTSTGDLQVSMPQAATVPSGPLPTDPVALQSEAERLVSTGGADPADRRIDFHIPTKVAHTLADWGRALRADPSGKTAAAFSLWQDELRNLVASLPERSVRDGTTGKAVDPFAALKERFPGGEAQPDPAAVVERMHDIARSVTGATGQDYVNLVELLHEVGVKTPESEASLERLNRSTYDSAESNAAMNEGNELESEGERMLRAAGEESSAAETAPSPRRLSNDRLDALEAMLVDEPIIDTPEQAAEHAKTEGLTNENSPETQIGNFADFTEPPSEPPAGSAKERTADTQGTGSAAESAPAGERAAAAPKIVETPLERARRVVAEREDDLVQAREDGDYELAASLSRVLPKLRRDLAETERKAASAPEPAAEKPAATELWQRTRDQVGNMLAKHRESVRDAVKAKKPVPDEVLAEYKGAAWADKEISRRSKEERENPAQTPTKETQKEWWSDAVIPTEGLGSIYQMERGGDTKWMVQESDKRGFGDSIHDSENDAVRSASIAAKQREERATSLRKLQERKASEDKAKATSEELDGFDSGMTPMKRGAVIKQLTTRLNYRGTEMTRRDLIRKLVNEGRRVESEDGERRLINDRDEFLGEKTLTKAGMDYAEHLIGRRKPSLTEPREAQTPDRIESALDRAIESLKPKPGDLLADPLFIQSVGKPVLRAALQVVRAAYKGGKSAVEAIADGMAYLRANAKDLDEEKAKAFFDDLYEPEAPKADEGGTPPPKEPKAAAAAAPEPGGEDVTPTGPPKDVPAADEAPAPDSRTTSTKNSVADAERVARGLEPIESAARQAVGVPWDKAGETLERDPNAGRELVDSTLRDPARPISTEEEAILLRHKVKLQNDIDHFTKRAVDESLPDGDREEARLKSAQLLEDNNRLDEATRARGTVWGRLGQFRQQLAQDDFTLAAMLQRSRASRGEALPPERVAEVTAQQAAIEKATAASDAHEAMKEQQAADAHVDAHIAHLIEEVRRLEAKKTASRKPSTSAAPRKPLSETVLKFIDDRVSAAMERIQARRGKLFATIDPLNIAGLTDEAIIGAGHIAKGVVTFAKWSEAMLKDLGDYVQPTLRPLFRAAKERARAWMAEAPRDFPAERQATSTGIKRRMSEGDQLTDLGRYVQALAEQFVSEGIRERDPLIDAVYVVLKEVVPDISRRQTMDAISGYGDFKPLNTDAVKVQLRDLKGQMQQVGKIEDMTAGQPPAKTGVERRTPSDEERRLTAEVNDLKKKGGFTVTDPATQLKSALDGIKTRLKNQIADYDFQIATGQKIIRERTPVADDAEATALRARRDAAKAEFDKVFGQSELTDAERIKLATAALERSIADYTKRIADGKKGVFEGKAPTKTPNTQELDAMTARRDAMRAELGTLKDLDSNLQERAKIKKLESSVADLEKQLAAGGIKPDPAAPRAGPETERVAELNSRRDILSKKLKNLRETNGLNDAAQIKAALKGIEKSIADYDARLKTGDISAKTGKPGVSSPELEQLRSERDAMAALVKEMRDAARPKKTAEQISLQAFKTRTANRIAELRAKLAAGDFSTRPRVPVKLDPEGLKLKASAEKAKLDYDRGNARDRLANRTVPEKTLDGLAKWRRAFVLSGVHTLAKLVSAAGEIVTIAPIEEAAGSVIRQIPGISRIAEQAPRHGGGFSLNAETKALVGTVTNLFRDSADYLRTGHTSLDLVYGKPDVMPPTLLDFVGRVHGALKTPARRNEFIRSFEQRAEAANRNGVDTTDPMVQTKLMMDAYRDANAAIFMEDNRVVSAYKRAVAALEEKNKETGKVSTLGKLGATTAKLLLPVVKIPTNIVARTFEYSFGTGIGAVRAARALAKGIENLKPEEADIIMRNLKRGSVGLAVLALGYFNPDSVGGYYQQGDKKKPGDIGYGALRINGVEIPKFLIHNPLLEQLQIGASIRRLADAKVRKNSPETNGIGAAMFDTYADVLKEVPFTRTAQDVVEVLNRKEHPAAVSNLVKGLVVPQASQEAATFFDKDASGNTIKRKPGTVVQHIKTGIPGARQTVPRK